MFPCNGCGACFALIPFLLLIFKLYSKKILITLVILCLVGGVVVAAEWQCKRCGKCCELYNPFTEDHKGPCPKLTYDEKGLAVCTIYGDDRPEICKTYPEHGRCLWNGGNAKMNQEEIRKFKRD